MVNFMWLFILSSIILILVWFISIYNRLVRLKAMSDEAWSGIDVQLKRRYDLIPNLVQTVKGYGIHEKEIFQQIAQARAASIGAKQIDEKSKAENNLTQALQHLFAVVENYPTLKANENFLSLQKELSQIEHELQLSRRYYNGASRQYNIAINTFPDTICAKITGFKSIPYFEISNTQEKENPKVSFE